MFCFNLNSQMNIQRHYSAQLKKSLHSFFRCQSQTQKKIKLSTSVMKLSVKWYYPLLQCKEAEKQFSIFVSHLTTLWHAHCQKQVPSFQLWKKENNRKYCWILHNGQTGIRLISLHFQISLANTNRSEQHQGLVFVGVIGDVGRSSSSSNRQMGITHLLYVAWFV